jgi:hypothetical protein
MVAMAQKDYAERWLGERRGMRGYKVLVLFTKSCLDGYHEQRITRLIAGRRNAKPMSDAADVTALSQVHGGGGASPAETIAGIIIASAACILPSGE